jgi:hypothetical protein
MQRASWMFVVIAAAVACGKKSSDGLPPATEWQAPTVGGGGGPTMGGGAAANPHAGVPGAPPLGGGGGDPHAGVPGAPPLAGSDGSDPHAGVAGAPAMGGGGVDVAQLGLPPPDPTRPVDPTKFIGGTIDVPAALRAKIPTGAAIFVAVRAQDPSSGDGSGPPIAVDKLEATGTWPMTWKVTEAQAMIGGTGFQGKVVVSVRFDQDSDAMSKQPGDITGKAAATIPAANVQIVLDTTL